MKPKKVKKNNLFDKIFTNNCYAWLAAVCSGVICLIVAFVYEMVPFGDITILRMDMYHQYCPLFAELYDRVTGLKSLMYSWETGLGSSFIGNFYNYLSSPSAFFVLLFGHRNVTEAIAAMIFSKSAFSAFSFTYYLKKAYGNSDFACAGFGVIYSMCGWFIAYYWDLMWIDAMVFFPIVILGIRRIIIKRNPAYYILALTLTLLTNYYMGYMVCLFSVIYFIVCYFSIYKFTESENIAGYWTKLNGKKTMTLSQRLKNSLFFRSGALFAVSSLISAALCAFALLPVYFILQNCYATNDSFPTQWNLYFSVFDFIANHLSSVEPTIRSSGDVVLPNVWCGLGTLMLVPMYLFTKSISVKEKIANVILLAVLFVSFDVNVLSFIWHAFHYPSDLPYRFSFMYCFILLTIAYKTFVRIKEFTARQILGAGIALMAFIIIVQKTQQANVDDTTVLVSIIFVVVYSLILYSAQSGKFHKATVAVMLLCCTIGETVCATVPHYDIDQPKANYAGDYNDFRTLKKEIDEKENGDFYRMEITYNRARMDPAWYNYNGVSTFTSMAYEKLSKLEKYLGLAGNNVDSYTYHLQTPIYNMMHSLKYIFDNDENVTVENDYYKKIDEKGVFTAYSVNHYLPIAYCVNNDLREWYYSGNNPLAVQEEWFELATGLPYAMEKADIIDISYYNVNEITSGLETGNIYYDKIDYGEEGEITFWISSEEAKHYYLYVDSGQFEYISISMNDVVRSQSINEPYVWDLGIITPDSPANVVITIDSQHDYGAFDFYVYGTDDYALDSGYAILNQNTIDITEFKDTKIKGKITVPQGKFIYTSIPYDKGWTVRLNGVKVSDENIFSLGEGFLCIKANPGEYDIEFSFVGRGVVAGALISVSALILLIAVYLIIRARKNKQVYMDLMINGTKENVDDEFPVETGIIFPLDSSEFEGELPPDEEIASSETDETENSPQDEEVL